MVKYLEKNVDYLLRLRLLRYRQTPYDHLRVKAHASSVSILTFTLGRLYNFGEISGDKIQAGRFFSICLLFLSQPIGICGFKGYTLFKVKKNSAAVYTGILLFWKSFLLRVTMQSAPSASAEQCCVASS